MHPPRSARQVYPIEANFDEAACDRILNSLCRPARETGCSVRCPPSRSEVVERSRA